MTRSINLERLDLASDQQLADAYAAAGALQRGSSDEEAAERRAALIEARRRRWDARRRAKITMSFDEFLEAFETDCITMSSLAAANGVSCERVRQIYQKWFADIVGWSGGGERLAACRVVRRAVRATTPPQEGTALRKVWDAATERGFDVERVVGHWATDLIVAARRVNVRSLGLSKIGNCVYGHMLLPKGAGVWRAAFMVVAFDGDFWIIPKAVLVEYCSRSRSPTPTVYLPIGDAAGEHANLGLGVDFRPYRGAWNLLRGEG